MAAAAPRVVERPDAPSGELSWFGVEAHDREQLEAQLSHPLVGRVPGEAEWTELELFVFVPRNIGVTAGNYPKEEFFGDLTSFLRLDLPELELGELADLSSVRSPLTLLRRTLSAVGRGESAGDGVRVALRLFGHAFAEAVHSQESELKAAIARAASSSELLALAPQFDRLGKQARAALEALRAARVQLLPYGQVLPEALAVIEQTDEYSSLYLDHALARLSDAIDCRIDLLDGSGSSPHIIALLRAVAHGEARYRGGRGFLVAPSRDGGEYFAYRRAILKKAVQQALYVDTRRIPSDKFIRNATGMMAASLAATWALVAQLPLRLSGLSPSLQTLFLVLPVIAYVAKDRIKELTREWLSGRLRSFDHDNALHTETLLEAGLGTVRGRVRERLSFHAPGDLPHAVLDARLAGRTVAGSEARGETVLLYRRRLEYELLGSSSVASLAMRQVVRLNLRHFLTRLDEPVQAVPHYDLTHARFERAELPKVYHLNLVARLSLSTGDARFERIRVVLNKDGIVRLDRVPLR
jgi:hypothetical protein